METQNYIYKFSQNYFLKSTSSKLWGRADSRRGGEEEDMEGQMIKDEEEEEGEDNCW